MATVLTYTGYTWVYENYFQLGIAGINSMLYSFITQAPYGIPFWLALMGFFMVVGGLIFVWKFPKNVTSFLYHW